MLFISETFFFINFLYPTLTSRNVNFYADIFYIIPRYLTNIVQSYYAHSSK